MLSFLLALACSASTPATFQEGATPATPVTEADAAAERFVAFAEAVEATIAEGDPSFMASHFDVGGLVAIMDAGLDAPADYREPFTEGLGSNFDLAAQIVGANAQFDGTYRFLRLMSGEPTRALFRLESNNGLNYHELHLVADAESVRIVDAFVYVSGESLSTTFKRGYVAGLVQYDPSLADTLPPTQKNYLSTLGALQRIKSVLASDPAAALAMWSELDASVKFLPEFLGARIAAASNVGEKEYLAALRDLREHYPDSPSMNLMMIDAYLLRGEFDQSLKCVDALDEQVGGDPYLELIRANIHLADGKFERAEKKVRRAIELDPLLDYLAQWKLIEIGLTADLHELTFEGLSSLETDYGIEWIDLRTAAGYESFVASEPGRRWIERWLAANGGGR
ncbi:hypothetical protein Pla163_10480 [Planctomycetes bacterium Pla163]|uniref:Tetratricopeptide repeat protein n=1 Tax=Rohdeia mirabilis TaxID=2528008 RepID=A0A518CXL1_9BACT|nr:hypothetical protein Pla163_10480 [Planctomycetes bacterium Pla163]